LGLRWFRWSGSLRGGGQRGEGQERDENETHESPLGTGYILKRKLPESNGDTAKGL
jgi:hypothetical protein